MLLSGQSRLYNEYYLYIVCIDSLTGRGRCRSRAVSMAFQDDIKVFFFFHFLTFLACLFGTIRRGRSTTPALSALILTSHVERGTCHDVVPFDEQDPSSTSPPFVICLHSCQCAMYVFTLISSFIVCVYVCARLFQAYFK